MEDTIEKGITITFKGDTLDFDKGVSKINGELKDLKSELSLLNRELKLDPTNFDKLSQKMDLLKERESLLKEELDAYKRSMETLDKDSDEFKKAEQKARNLEIEIGYVTKAIDDMGGNKLTLALNNIGNQLDNLGGKFTSLGKSFAGISASAGAVVGGFAKLSYDVIKSADDINTLSKQTGLSTDTLQAFGQMADLIDVDLNTMAKSAQYLAKNIDNKNAISGYEKLGISVRNANGEYKDAESLLFETIKALQKVENDTERSALANDLLGKSYTELGSIINDASVDLDSINQQVRENGVILSQDELNNLNKANDNIDTFKMTIAGLGTSLVSEFQEPIQKVTEKLVALAQKIKDITSKISTEDKERILTIIGVIALISPILLLIGTTLSALGSVITTIGSIIQFIIPLVSGLFGIIVANPIGALVTLIGVALVGAIAYCAKHWEEIKEKVSEVWEKFQQTEFVQTLIEWFDKLIEKVQSVVEWFRNLFDWVGNVISEVGDFFSSGIDKVVSFFSSGGFGNVGAYASGGYGSLELNTTINVNNNGANLSTLDAQRFGRQIVEYVNDKLGRRI